MQHELGTTRAYGELLAPLDAWSAGGVCATGHLSRTHDGSGGRRP